MTDVTASLSTALTDHYRIEWHLGEGGMANGTHANNATLPSRW